MLKVISGKKYLNVIILLIIIHTDTYLYTEGKLLKWTIVWCVCVVM